MKVNHKSLIIFIFILFILFIFFKSIQNSDSPDFEHLSDEWPEACKKLKENYKSETYIVFSEKFHVKFDAFVWVLKWEVLNIPIPAIKYNVVYLMANKKGNIDFLLLKSHIGISIAISHLENTFVNDVFAKSTLKIAHKNEYATKKFNHEETTSYKKIEINKIENETTITKKIFVNPLSLVDIMIMGYENTPDDLKCFKVDYKEAAIAFALNLKNLYSDLYKLKAVYKGVGIYKGIIEKTINVNKSRYNLFIESPKKNKKSI